MLIVFVKLALHKSVSARPISLIHQHIKLQLGDFLDRTYFCQLSSIPLFDYAPHLLLYVELTRILRHFKRYKVVSYIGNNLEGRMRFMAVKD